jgi:hypothetical protein
LGAPARYARISEPQRLQRAPQYRPTLVDPYRDHLRARRALEPAVAVTTLFQQIRGLGYDGSLNLLYRYITQGRVEGDRPPISPGGLARLILTRPDRLTDKQRQLRDDLVAACPEMIHLARLVTGFAQLLKPSSGNDSRLDDWITTVTAADLPHLHAFTRGLAQDRDAVNAGLALPYPNGGTEGVNTKPKNHASDARPSQLRPTPPPDPPRITTHPPPPKVSQTQLVGVTGFLRVSGVRWTGVRQTHSTRTSSGRSSGVGRGRLVRGGDRQVEALEGGGLVREVAAGAYRAAQPGSAVTCAVRPPWVRSIR